MVFEGMGDIKVIFVKVDGHAETQAVIDEAFKCSKGEELLTVWVSEDECFNVTQKQKDEIYVFDVFSGEAFDHITGLGCRVLGPMCLVTSLVCKKEIPRTSKPIYNLAMKDIIVCCTNIDKDERGPLHNMVEWMGGQVTLDFTADVTHLVAKTVGSKIYLVAANSGKQIMLPRWVDEIWKKSKLEAVHGNDEQFQEYKCPIFKGHVITTFLKRSKRNEAKKLIEKEGGIYSARMLVKECTHLIVNEPKGQKYILAKKWEIHIVRSEWLYESIEKGFCQDEASYPVTTDGEEEGKMKTSTAERLSSVYCHLSDLNNISMISMAVTGNVTNMARLDDPSLTLDLTEAPEDLFLDGCKIFLSGFQGSTLECVINIINSGGGTRCNQISDNLTHVVVGEKINTDIENIKSLSSRPHIVTSQWLVECYKHEKLVDESKYLSAEVSQPKPKTPEAKSKKRNTRVQDEIQASKPQVEQHNDDAMNDMMSQYLDQLQQDVSKSDDVTLVNVDEDMTQDPDSTLDVSKSDDVTLVNVDEDMTQDPDSTLDVSESDDVTLVNVDEDMTQDPDSTLDVSESDDVTLVNVDEDMTQDPDSTLGTVLKTNAQAVPDYAVVPTDGFPVDRTVKDIVTNQICKEQCEFAVSKQCAFACAYSVKREPEDRFLIDNITNDNVLDISTLDHNSIEKNLEKNPATMGTPALTKQSAKEKDQGRCKIERIKHQTPLQGRIKESSVLQGVVIIVAKKLTKDQSELNDLAASLGGDYRWNYDVSCTHFIFQGRQKDTTLEFKHAKSQGMKIVSPYWLYLCKEQNARVDESLFPHTFNPNLSLSPMRTRRTTRAAHANSINT